MYTLQSKHAGVPGRTEWRSRSQHRMQMSLQRASPRVCFVCAVLLYSSPMSPCLLKQAWGQHDPHTHRHTDPPGKNSYSSSCNAARKSATTPASISRAAGRHTRSGLGQDELERAAQPAPCCCCCHRRALAPCSGLVTGCWLSAAGPGAGLCPAAPCALYSRASRIVSFRSRWQQLRSAASHHRSTVVGAKQTGGLISASTPAAAQPPLSGNMQHMESPTKATAPSSVAKEESSW